MLAAHDTSTATRGSYARRQPETTVLYRVVRDHLPALLDHARDRSEHGFARLLDQIARAIHRLVERHRASRGDDPPPDLLASEQARAVADSLSRGRAPFPRPTGRRSAFLDGYSLHADRLVDTDDRDGLERLARNGARSPMRTTPPPRS